MIEPTSISIAVIKRQQHYVENQRYYLSDIQLKRGNNTLNVSEIKIIFSVADVNRSIDA